MGFELQIAGFVLLGISTLNSIITTAVLWHGRAAPGIRTWITGLWVGTFGTFLLTVPSAHWDTPLALFRNGAHIAASGCIALGSAAFLNRRIHYLWVPASILLALPFILHWVPGLSPFASRAAIVSLAVSGWMGWGAWLWMAYGRPLYRGSALFTAGLFAVRAFFNLTRGSYLLLTRPGSVTEVEWLQATTYMESALFLVVLGLTLWVLATLRGRTQGRAAHR